MTAIAQEALAGMPEPQHFAAEPGAVPAAREPVTERAMLDALHHRYARVSPGNGPRYVIAEHVRSHASFDARRTADFVAMDTWKTGKFEFHGHEVKVSRSDWLRELKQPEKAAEFTPYMHRWWIVAAHGGIVKPEELPAEWGLLVLTGITRQLRAVRAAPRLDAIPLPPTRLAALLRAVQATARAAAS